MRRMAVALIAECDYDTSSYAAVSAAVTSIVRPQSYAPLSQSSVARPAARGYGRRLITFS